MFPLRSKLHKIISLELRHNFARTSTQLRLNFDSTSLELRHNSLQLRHNFARTSTQLRSNFDTTSLELRHNSLQLRYNLARTSGQLHLNFNSTVRLKFDTTRLELQLSFSQTSAQLRPIVAPVSKDFRRNSMFERSWKGSKDPFNFARRLIQLQCSYT